MAARVRVAAAIVVAVGALAGLVVLLAHVRAAEDGSTHLSFAATRPAASPFSSFSEARVAVGSRCMRVLVASTPNQRVQGLRDVRTLAPYDGMLFVYEGDSSAQFTMASTPMPLDMTWYASSGDPVDRTRMEPCPNGSDATCPAYASRRRYRYALEQPAGSAATGALGACAA